MGIVSTWAKLIVHFETAGSREQGAGRKGYNSVVNIQFILFKYLVCQDSFEGLVRVILDFRLPRFARNASQFWILENCPIPHFKIDRPIV
jgi:hypothetical protein